MSGDQRPHIVVMGVTGCGKTTVAQQLSELTGHRFLDADDLHPPSNVEKMAAGIPLTDDDRAPWLAVVRDRLQALSDQGRRGVVACSALRQSYRDILRDVSDPVLFVHLTGEREVIHGRMQARSGHFMPPALLDSQFALLEPLDADEFGVVLDVAPAPDAIARAAAEYLHEERKVATQ
ncbi:gluconokinase [Rhodococcus jostii]|jgi:gluconokinase|nr:gluconokinase [Rhodococcus jostii]